MNNYREIKQQLLTGERALFHESELRVVDSVFDGGESPLKESHDIELVSSMFKWKYPIWYAKNIVARDCAFLKNARAGMWYVDGLTLDNCTSEAHKGVRRCNRVRMNNVAFADAIETLWFCRDVELDSVSVKGDYFAMNSEDMKIKNLTLFGLYSFDGVKNVTIENSRLVTKDAFWNSENVTAKNCYIAGEYLGWNAKNLTLIDCTIESLQGLCYTDNLVMRNCKLLNTTLAFEYSTVDAEISSKIDSVLNPTSGRIIADSIGELTLEHDRIDPEKTVITVRK